MLNTVKNLAVVAILLGVGYGARIVLTEPVTHEGSQSEDWTEWDDPVVDMDQAQPMRPTVSLGEADSPTSAAGRPPVASDVEVAEDRTPLPPIGSVPVAAEPPAAVEPIGAQPVGAEPVSAARHATAASAAAVAGDAAASAQTATDDSVSSAPATQPATSAQTGQSDASASQLPEQAAAPESTAPQQQASAPSADPHQDRLAELARSVQQQLDNDQLAEALAALTQWYCDPTTAEEHREQLHPLLDQLAGTVIYSRHHLLEAPHVVQEQETLEQIAQQYQVPMILLAKINGIQPPLELVPNETLKVVRGPFRAEASLSHRELTLFVGPYYAGRFPVELGSESPGQEASLEVIEKLDERAYTDAQTRQEIPAGSPENPYGRHWIGLGQAGSTAAASLGIHGKGVGCEPADPRGSIRLAPQDAEDLYSILSIGSTVRITR